ncbi:MAG: hypothetical protein ACLFUU_08930 [Desulfobacteraceae bacterium]
MEGKQIVFSDKDQLEIEAIVIDKDQDEALKFLDQLLERLKGHPGFVCGFRPFK